MSRLDAVDYDTLSFDNNDYSVFRSWNKYNLWKNKFESAYALREKLQRVDIDKYEALFILGFEFIYGLKEIVRRKKTILCTDTTDIQSHALVRRTDTSSLAAVKCYAKDLITSRIYKSIISQIAVFSPMSECCAQSLRDDYNVSDKRIVVIRGGLDLTRWTPAKTTRLDRRNPIRLLFVGNDLRRKGGFFLLEAFRKSLREKCSLTIVTNDPIASSLKPPKGVSIVAGITHQQIGKLISLYQNNDLFVLPTSNDKLGHVFKEAAASGLAIVSHNIAAIKEMVINNYNGYLLEPGASMESWISIIEGFERDREKLTTFCANSRILAERHFGIDRMLSDLSHAVELLEL